MDFNNIAIVYDNFSKVTSEIGRPSEACDGGPYTIPCIHINDKGSTPPRKTVIKVKKKCKEKLKMILQENENIVHILQLISVLARPHLTICTH